MISFKKYNIQYWLEIFFSLVLLELFMGGGGRLIMVGPLTLRMVLFIMTLLISGMLLINKVRIDLFYLKLLILFMILLAFAGATGYYHQAKPAAIFTDIKPLLYFLSVIFFAMIIKTWQQVQIISRVIKIAAAALSIIYLAVMFLVLCRVVTFGQLYYLNDARFYSEFAFNGYYGCFYFKGFILLSIGFFFYFFETSVSSKIMAFLILLSVLLTLSRGLALDILIMDLIYIIYKRKDNLKWKDHIFLISFIVIYLICYGWIRFSGNGMQVMGDKGESNLARIQQIKEVFDNMSFSSFFIGHGFGIGVPCKNVHMEITYLEIFHKQGILGLFFWFYLFMKIMVNFRKIDQHSAIYDKSIPLLFAVLIIYLHSLTNPYLINPIGISIVMTVFVSFQVLSKGEKK